MSLAEDNDISYKQEINSVKSNTKPSIIVFFVLLTGIIVSKLISMGISELFNDYRDGIFKKTFCELVETAILTVVYLIAYYIYKRFTEERLNVSLETRGKELSCWRFIAVSAIVIISILFISYIIDFNIKLFMDMGRVKTRYDYYVSFARWIKTALKCLYIVSMLKLFHNIIDKAFHNIKWLPVCGVLLLLTVGLFDLLACSNTLPITYLFLNIVFDIIYILCNKSFSKTYLITILIYLL